MLFVMSKRAFAGSAVVLGLALAAHGQMPRTSPSQPSQPSPTAPHMSPDPSADPLATPAVQQDVPYGKVGAHALLLDIYQPAEHSDLRPAIVLIHGGGWTSFDKSTMGRLGAFLAQSGFVAFSVDYRLFHEKEKDNLWPAQLDDVQRAVRWIRANAAKYGVDPQQIGAFGHSAGAQLAALLGMENTRDNSDLALAKYSSRVQAVVDVSGPTDFTINRDADGDPFLSSFFGGDYAHAAKTWEDASPVFHVSKKVAPFLIVHGTKDSEVPIEQAQELADKLKQAGASVKFMTVEDVHTFQSPEVKMRLAFATRDFFMQYLNR
jgi:acetyl esterase/lipase